MGIVATTARLFASSTVASLDAPLKVNTCFPAARTESRRIRLSLGLLNDFQRVQVKRGHRVGASVARETAIQGVGEGDAVHALRFRYVADDLARFNADDIDAGCTADEESPLASRAR